MAKEQKSNKISSSPKKTYASDTGAKRVTPSANTGSKPNYSVSDTGNKGSRTSSDTKSKGQSSTNGYQGAGSFSRTSEDEYITPVELRGKSDEDVAAKKTAASYKTSTDKWQVTDSSISTVTATAEENANTGNKHAYSDGSSSAKAYHSTDTASQGQRFDYKDEGELTTPNAKVTDASGRMLETGQGVKSGTLSSNNPGLLAVDVSKVNKNGGKARTLAEAAEQSVKRRYEDSDVHQGAEETKQEAKNIAFASGATFIGRKILRSSVRAAVHSDIISRKKIDIRYSKFDVDEKTGERLKGKPGIIENNAKESGIVVTEKGDTALRRGIEQAESASSGRKYVTSTKNSYGSLSKDIKNNMDIIDSYFASKNLDISEYTEGQLKRAIHTGKLKNKVGTDVMLSQEDKALLSEKASLLKKKKAMQATGSWKDDVSDFAGNAYGDTDFYQGYKVTKNTIKVAKATGIAARAGGIAAAKEIEGAATGVALASNKIGEIGSRAVGVAGKKSRKWQQETRLKYHHRSAVIKAKSAGIRYTTGDVIKHPIKYAGKGTKFVLKNTLGRTRLGKGVTSASKIVRNRIGGRITAFRKATLRIKNNPFVRVVGAPFRFLGKVVSAVNTAKIILIIAVLLLVAFMTMMIIITSAISSIIPDGADKSNFESGTTLWDMSKDGMNQELKNIADETESWMNKNYRAYRMNYGGLAIRYKTQFIFSGFEIYGPTNTVTERDEDTDAIKSYDTSLDKAEGKGTASVNDSATAANGPLSGSTSATLTRRKGTVQGPSGKETYYNMDMANCVHTLDLHAKGKIGGLSDKAHYFVRSDGVKCYGDENGIAYVMVAANLSLRPKGTILPTSLGPGIVADTGLFATTNPRQLDIAVAWTSGGDDDKYKTINSGTVDTWGSDLNAGAIYVDGSTGCPSNYLRGILAMAATATGNESEPDNSAFYTSYCRHILRNSYNYSKYVAALNLKGKKKAKKIYGEPPAKEKWDDNCPTGFFSPAFDVQVMDKEYNSYEHLTGVIFSVKLRLFDCGLWGEGDYRDEPEDNGWKFAGKGAAPYVDPTKVGMFDVESYPYSAKDAAGDKVSNDICDDDFIHNLAKSGSEEYDVLDKKDKGYEIWDGWPDSGFFDDNTECIYESGSNTSNVEATYDIDDEDWADMGVSFDGLYNIDRTVDDTDIGGTSAPLSSEDIAKISNNVSSSLTKDDAPERAAVIAKALSLCGKVKYTWGGSWNSSTTDSDIMRTGLDCAAFVSYCAYKGTHENGNHLNIGFSSVQHTAQLKSAGKDCGKNLRPGDVLVKIQGKDSQGYYRCHAVMYIGSTSMGKFTIVEESGSKGAHLSGYKSYKYFEARRGDGVGYQYHRNLFGD